MKYIKLLFLLIPSIATAEPFQVEAITPSQSIDETHIEKNSLEWIKFSTFGAVEGDALYFNGIKWGPAPLSGVNFKGTWNPNTNVPIIGADFYDDGSRKDATSGDYFIVTESKPDYSWGRGDWIIFNGTNWERLNNSGVVKSIFGRKGNVFPRKNDISWKDLDFTGGHLYDLSDVKSFTPQEAPSLKDFALKWNSTLETFELKEEEMGYVGEITSDEILDGEVHDIDISNTAKIYYQKIKGFDQDLTKLKYEGGEVTNLDITGHDLIAGETGFVKILYPDGSEKVIIFEDLYNQIVALKEKYDLTENKIVSSGNSEDYMSGELNLVGQTRIFKHSNLDYAKEDGDHKFLTDENVWKSKIPDYDISAYSAIEVNNTDTLKDAIGKLDAQFSNNSLQVILDTPSIDDKTIELKHLNKDFSSDTGFLFLSEVDPKEWKISSFSGLQYKGEIDLNSDSFPGADNLAGDYYVILDAFDDTGGATGITWNKGDWGIYDGTNWLQINNSGKVFEFNGRDGEVISCPASDCPNIFDYSWKMLDFTNSKLEEIENVSAPFGIGDIGKILKYDGGTWVLRDDEDGSNAASIDKDSIDDEVIENRHVSDLAISQISNLQKDLDEKLPKSGGTLFGDLDMGLNSLRNISNINGRDFGEVFLLAKDFQTKLDEKQDELALPIDPGRFILLGDKTFKLLNTESVIEGSTNLYFTEDRTLDAVTSESFSFSGGDNSILYDENDTTKQDTVLEAIRKLNDRLMASSSGTDFVDGEAIMPGTVAKEKLALADFEGETFNFNNGAWEYSSISGLNYKDTWDATTTPDTNINIGDYYIVTVAGSYDGIDFRKDDWAVFTGSSFQRINKSEKVTSFNGRIGDILPAAGDYSWDMINKDISQLSSFEDVAYTLGSGLEDLKKTLAWDSATSKWIPKDDLTQLSVADLTVDHFSKGEDGAKKAITEADISSISFDDINGLKDYYNTNFINLNPDSGNIEFDNNISFSLLPDGSRTHNLENLDEIVHPDGRRVSFNTLYNNCSLLDKDLYETLPTGDTDKQLVDGNRSWNTLKFSYIDGDFSQYIYEKARIQNLKLEGYTTFSSVNPSFEKESTGFLDIFENLEAMAKQSGQPIIYENTSPESFIVTPSMHGSKYVLSDSGLSFSLPCTLPDGFEITLSISSDSNISFKRILGSCLIEGSSPKGIIRTTTSSTQNIYNNSKQRNVTIRKVGNGTTANDEFIILSSFSNY